MFTLSNSVSSLTSIRWGSWGIAEGAAIFGPGDTCSSIANFSPSTRSAVRGKGCFQQRGLISPAYDVPEIAIIVGPGDGPRRRGRKRFRVRGELLAGERRGIAREQDPVGLRKRAGGQERIDAHGVQAE